MTNLPLQDNIVGQWDLYKGSFRDQSRLYNNHSTPSNVYWNKAPNQGIVFNASGRLDISDSPELQLTSLSVSAYNSNGFKTPTGTEYVIVKKDGGGSNFLMYWDSTKVYLSDGSTVSELTFSVAGKKNITLTCNTGEKPKLYSNGVYEGEGNNTLTITTNDAPIKIGSDENNANQLSRLEGLILWDAVLTESQVSSVYSITDSIQSVSYKKKNFYAPSKINPREDGLVAAYDMENVGQKIIDKVGGNDGDIVGCRSSSGPLGKSLWFDGNNSYNVSITIDLTSYSDVTFSYLFKYEVDNKYSVSYGVPNDNISYGVNSGKARIDNDIDNANQGLFGTTTLTIGKWYQALCEIHSDGTKTFYVDNSVEISNTEHTTNLTDASGTTLTLSGRYGFNFWTGELADLRVYNKILSAAEKNNLYKQYAKTPLYIEDFSDANESVTAQTVFVENTDFKVASGSFKIARDETNRPGKKHLECVSSGVAYIQSDMVFGTWEWDMWKGTGGTQPLVMFVASRFEDSFLAPADNYGYGLYMNTSAFRRVLLVENSGASVANLAYTGTNYVAEYGEWYSFRVTRRYDGQITMYIKGGSFSNWTLIDVSGGSGSNPTTDISTTDSKFFVLELDSLDRIADLKFYQGIAD